MEAIKEDPLVNLLQSFIKVYLSQKDAPKAEAVNHLNGIPRMRTAKEAVEEIKKVDPNTGITEYYVKQLALSGVIPSVMAGSKRLVNLNALFEYLQSHADEPTEDERGTIRPVK